MSVGGIIKSVLKAAGKYIVENPVQTASIVGATVGTIGATVGTGNVIAANNTNKKATEIYEAAIKKNAKSEEEVGVVLDGLAERQIYAASLFEDFADLIEKIKGRPDRLFQGDEFNSLPRFNAEEFKVLSNNARLILDVVGGATFGTVVGAAAAGIQVAAFGFSAFAAGSVLFIKGNSLRKKAEENYQRADAIKQEVDSIVSFHSLLMEAAGLVARSIDGILSQFKSHVIKLKEIVSHSTDWNDYTECEETIIENSIRLACLLNVLCTVKLTKKTENNKDVVDFDKVNLVEEEYRKLLPIIDSFNPFNKNVAAASFQ